MKIKNLIILTVSLFLGAGGVRPVYALEHAQRGGLFSMDVPSGWHWVEYPEEIIVTYSDGKTVAIDIQMVPSRKISQADVKKTIKEANDKMIKEGIEAHHGILIDDKEMKLDGVYATRLDFRVSPENPLIAAYISFFNKGYAFTITYGSGDEKIRSVMDDAVATFRFK